jgi:hypothetical protein
LKEYYLTAEAYYYALSQEDHPVNIETQAIHLEDKRNNVLINGWNSPSDALNTAFDASGFEALGVGAFGANLAGAVVPSPSGRLGGPQHQNLMKSLASRSNVKALYGPEHWARTEYYVRTPGGQKTTRFVDVAILGPEGPVAFYQIGRGLNNGNPVARERYALVDIIMFGGHDIPIYFIPYNR